ncbi:nucleotidyltransferase domain-containing protein [Spirochaeta lutea]|uniref:Polymerase nucleotidyl transferase domain-containing protein n=1 Tax=Spirochaeta lutea TaxID=1480694 RepID=A0A098QZQ8_9SPIO|nr:nucleotidyltransferase domain-containing protein [Spirochaeta lutea]KGE71977.1 hypothetical protein DC28_09315 [Spirochaeta lutea]
MNTSHDPWFARVIEGLKDLPGVEAIALGGSRGAGTSDAGSDYDLYVYVREMVDPSRREAILAPLCSYLEVNNQFWETEDDGILRSGIPVDVVYRSLDWLTEHLESLLGAGQAATGYTTCFWYNLLNSRVLYDPRGGYAALQEKWRIAYPRKLQENILSKNLPLLRGKLPSYLGQVEKAVGRNDWVSVHHRVTALMESVFDILFALGEMPHPGEKRQVQFLLDAGTPVPENFEDQVENIMENTGPAGAAVLPGLLNTLIDGVYSLAGWIEHE